jgi:hypothetical protein
LNRTSEMSLREQWRLLSRVNNISWICTGRSFLDGHGHYLWITQYIWIENDKRWFEPDADHSSDINWYFWKLLRTRHAVPSPDRTTDFLTTVCRWQDHEWLRSLSSLTHGDNLIPFRLSKIKMEDVTESITFFATDQNFKCLRKCPSNL